MHGRGATHRLSMSVHGSSWSIAWPTETSCGALWCWLPTRMQTRFGPRVAERVRAGLRLGCAAEKVAALQGEAVIKDLRDWS